MNPLHFAHLVADSCGDDDGDSRVRPCHWLIREASESGVSQRRVIYLSYSFTITDIFQWNTEGGMSFDVPV